MSKKRVLVEVLTDISKMPSSETSAFTRLCQILNEALNKDPADLPKTHPAEDIAYQGQTNLKDLINEMFEVELSYIKAKALEAPEGSDEFKVFQKLHQKMDAEIRPKLNLIVKNMDENILGNSAYFAEIVSNLHQSIVQEQIKEVHKVGLIKDQIDLSPAVMRDGVAKKLDTVKTMGPFDLAEDIGRRRPTQEDHFIAVQFDGNKSLSESYKALRDVNAKVKEQTKNMQDGTTATMGYFNPETKDLTFSNLGDSRIIQVVLNKDGSLDLENTKRVTYDQEIDGRNNMLEQMVYRQGGTVYHSVLDGSRINDSLKCGGAYGDVRVGKGVPSEATYGHTNFQNLIDAGKQVFVVASCDGLYEKGCLTDLTAGQVIEQYVQAGQKAPPTLAESLLRNAASRGSTDNITACVLNINEAANNKGQAAGFAIFDGHGGSECSKMAAEVAKSEMVGKFGAITRDIERDSQSAGSQVKVNPNPYINQTLQVKKSPQDMHIEWATNYISEMIISKESPENIKNMFIQNIFPQETVDRFLRLSSISGSMDVAKFLISKGANPMAVGQSGKNAHEFARENKNFELADYIAEVQQPKVGQASPPMPARPKPEIMNAKMAKPVEQRFAEEFLQTKMVKSPQEIHLDMLASKLYVMISSKAPSQEIKDMLNQNLFSQDTTDLFLRFAVSNGNMEIAKFLIERKNANPMAVGQSGKSVFEFAIENKNFELVNYIADVQAKKGVPIPGVPIPGVAEQMRQFIAEPEQQKQSPVAQDPQPKAAEPESNSTIIANAMIKRRGSMGEDDNTEIETWDDEPEKTTNASKDQQLKAEQVSQPEPARPNPEIMNAKMAKPVEQRFAEEFLQAKMVKSTQERHLDMLADKLNVMIANKAPSQEIKNMLNQNLFAQETTDRFLRFASANGNMEIAKFLIERKNANPMAVGQSGKNAHEFARENKNFELADYIADVQAKKGAPIPGVAEQMRQFTAEPQQQKPIVQAPQPKVPDQQFQQPKAEQASQPMQEAKKVTSKQKKQDKKIKKPKVKESSPDKKASFSLVKFLKNLFSNKSNMVTAVSEAKKQPTEVSQNSTTKGGPPPLPPKPKHMRGNPVTKDIAEIKNGLKGVSHIGDSNTVTKPVVPNAQQQDNSQGKGRV